MIHLNKLTFVELVHFQIALFREMTFGSKALQLNIILMDCILLTVMEETTFNISSFYQISTELTITLTRKFPLIIPQSIYLGNT